MDNITEFIKKQNSLSTLRFITCGSVDDGKSTLLGRMLYESQLIFDDQVDSLVRDSKRIGLFWGCFMEYLHLLGASLLLDPFWYLPPLGGT